MKKTLTALAAAGLFSTQAMAALTGFWNFEDSPGTTTEEIVSNTDSETFGTGVAFSSDTAAPGSTSSLAGSGSGLVLTNRTGADLGLTGPGAKTIVGWFKTSQTTGRHTIFSYSPSNGQGAGQDLRFVLDAGAGSGNGQLRLEISSGAATNTQVDLNDGQWHMVAAIIPANAQGKDIKFYIDGDIYNDGTTPTPSTTAVNTAAGTGSSTWGGATTEVSLGGAVLENNQSYLNGLIDDVRVYDEALDEAALDAIFVPEPASLVLMGLGGLLMLGRSRRD